MKSSSLLRRHIRCSSARIDREKGGGGEVGKRIERETGRGGGGERMRTEKRERENFVSSLPY